MPLAVISNVFFFLSPFEFVHVNSNRFPLFVQFPLEFVDGLALHCFLWQIVPFEFRVNFVGCMQYQVGIHEYQNDKSVPFVQNKKSIALVPKIFNWPKTIKPTTLSSWFKVAGGRALPLCGDNRL